MQMSLQMSLPMTGPDAPGGAGSGSGSGDGDSRGGVPEGVLAAFHPVVARWFRKRLGEPTLPQQHGWPAIHAGRHTLIAAPTGSGKTLAAFLCALDALIRQGLAGKLRAGTQILYVSPLKALSADVRKNLEEPLEELREEAAACGLHLPEIRIGLRTGDTSAAQRAAMAKTPPHILITTPESLYLCLTAGKMRAHLRSVRTVILDEIHAMLQDKRGAHLTLSLERLDALVGDRGQRPAPQRIGLSATVNPIEEVARFLVGTARVQVAPGAAPEVAIDDGTPDCHIVDSRRLSGTDRRPLDLRICVPKAPLEAVCSTEQFQDVHDQIADLIRAHQTTLVFVSTRRMCERVAHNLAERLGEGAVMAHHGSLSRGLRLRVEDRLRRGELKAVVATASLELGIDIGAIDLVCQLGSPRAISTFLQRVGRANHRPDPTAVPRARLFAMTRDELVECAALLAAVAEGRLDRQYSPPCPLDVLAQQVVAMCAVEEQDVSGLLALCRRAWPFRHLGEAELEPILTMLAEGVALRRGRSGAHLHWDRVNGRLRGRRGALLYAVQNGGTIPEPNDFEVVVEGEEIVVGRLDEEFVVESGPGDVFLLGSTSWRLVGTRGGRAYVRDAGGASPTVPFWAGEAPGRTFELSQSVAELRRAVEEALDRAAPAAAASDTGSALPPDDALAALYARLCGVCGLTQDAARQLVGYLCAGKSALGTLPTQDTLIAERFFDEGGGMQLVLHMPFGARQNRAFGLALRKKFCRAFNFELQAAATDDGVLLSLGETHSFPLETVWQFLVSARIDHVLHQAVLGAPVFNPHFRHVATRAFAIPRMRSGKKLPPPIVRILTEDLLGAVFPHAAACPENLPGGDIEIPDHPIVRETLRECTGEVMDLTSLRGLLERIESGAVKVLARDTTEPSPLSHQLLTAAPYAFLDDTPAEERRTRAVNVRRSPGPGIADDVLPQANGLDPQVVRAVRDTAWPKLRDSDELHDALLTLHVLPESHADWRGALGPLTERLVRERRATVLHVGDWVALVASERAAAVRALFTACAAENGAAPHFVPEPPAVEVPRREPPPRPGCAAPACDPGTDAAPDLEEEAERVLTEIVRGWLAVTGPWATADLAFTLRVPEPRAHAALVRLESEGMALRGRFLPSVPGLPEPPPEFCDRRLLAQIHRQTQRIERDRFRRTVTPATPAELWQFLARFQHVWPGTELHGAPGLLRVLAQLQGFVAGAAAWEESLLPARLRGFDPMWLDGLCLSGEVAWGRLRPGSGEGRLGRATPMSLWRRADADWLVPPRPDFAVFLAESKAAASGPKLSPVAEALGERLARRGARFFAELVRDLGQPPRDIVDGLAELCAAGLCTADGFAGLRLLLGQSSTQAAATAAGRWSLIEGPPAPPSNNNSGPRWRTAEASLGAEADWDRPALLEAWVQQYLARYGVVLRELLAREPLGPPPYKILPVLRRLEARGLLKSGYFVAGLSGEQYATPEAHEGLKLVQKLTRPPPGAPRPAPCELKISAADPLNLVGILFPGPKIPATAAAPVVFVDGVPREPEAPRQASSAA